MLRKDRGTDGQEENENDPVLHSVYPEFGEPGSEAGDSEELGLPTNVSHN